MGAPIEFKKDLKLTSAITIIVGSMIGSGILKLPASMIAEIQSPWAVLGLFLLAALLTITGALTFAEMSSMFPRAGGQYHFLKEGLGRPFSYLYGWTMFWVIQTGIIAAVAVVFAQFTDVVVEKLGGGGLPGTPVVWGPLTLPAWGEAFVAIACIIVLGTVNYFGVKNAGTLNNVATFAKGLGLMALVVMVVVMASPDEAAFDNAFPAEQTSGMAIAGAGLALALVMFAYDGWPQATYVAGEVQNPTKNVPRALVLGPVITAIVYMLVTAAYFLVISAERAAEIAANGEVIAVEAAKAAAGDVGVWFITIVGLISVFGTVNAYILTSPRVFYALAQDGALLPGMATMNDKGVPAYGLLMTVIWSSFLVMTGLYEALALTVVFGLFFWYIPTAIAHFRMRRTMADVERPFKTPARLFTVPVFLAASIYIVVTILSSPDWFFSGVLALILMAVGVPAYFLQERKRTA